MLKAKGILFSLAFTTGVSFVASNELNAQFHSLSNLHISESSSFSLQGTYSFDKGNGFVKPGIISTAKGGAKGYINFVQGSNWTGASNTQFIDGYVKVAHNNPFVFPIGANQQYRPVAISGGSMTSAAFYARNPAKIVAKASKVEGKSLNNTSNQLVIEKISKEGYWDLDGSNATSVTFTWGLESEIAELTNGKLSTLSVLGFKNGQWEVIASTADKYALDNASSELQASKNLSSLASGSITTDEAIIPNEYEFFTLGATNVALVAGETNFSLYPNPYLLTLPLNVAYQLPDVAGGTLKVFSATGALLAERTLSHESGIVTLSNVANIPGAYSVSITDSKGKTSTKKLVVVAE